MRERETEKKKRRREGRRKRQEDFHVSTTILCLILSLCPSLFHVRAFILSLTHPPPLVMIVDLLIVVVAVVFVRLFLLHLLRLTYPSSSSLSSVVPIGVFLPPQSDAISCLLIL